PNLASNLPPCSGRRIKSSSTLARYFQLSSIQDIMYTPKAFELNDPDLQHQLIHEYPFGTLVSEGKDKLAATHLPFLLTAGSQGKRLLQAHIAKSNSEFSQLQDGTPVLAVFHGPQAYVSPS